MSDLADKIKNSAAADAPDAYYGAVYEYSAVGMSAAENPILTQIIVNLLPAVRRIHFLALMHHTQDLKKNALYFERLTEHLLNHNPDGGEAVMREYISNQKSVALDAVRE